MLLGMKAGCNEEELQAAQARVQEAEKEAERAAQKLSILQQLVKATLTHSSKPPIVKTLFMRYLSLESLC